MAEEMNISVALKLEFPNGLTAVTVPRVAELYDETDASMPNKRCIRMSGIVDPTRTEANGAQCLLSWVTDYATAALIYTDAPGSLELGGSTVGLTGAQDGVWTKPLLAIPTDPIAPFTVEGLRKAGLV